MTFISELEAPFKATEITCFCDHTLPRNIGEDFAWFRQWFGHSAC